jgi:hypothetical protein
VVLAAVAIGGNVLLYTSLDDTTDVLNWDPPEESRVGAKLIKLSGLSTKFLHAMIRSVSQGHSRT